ncbi:MAG TPA: hypothetical protein DCG75_10215 [Bacteroidales bacterium]|jgi:hypothetical protein|nr:hypothetical protein [Bacteroidales bacterium]
MKILAIEKEKPGLTSDDFKPYSTNEAKMVWKLYENGVIREIYFGKEKHNAHIIMESENLETAKQILAELPLVKNNLIEFEFTTLIAYTGFSRLFTKTEE